MSSPNRKAFQACLVPNSTDVPGIPGPYFYQRSRHTWSPLLSMFQAYLVPIITDVPCIPSLPLYGALDWKQENCSFSFRNHSKAKNSLQLEKMLSVRRPCVSMTSKRTKFIILQLKRKFSLWKRSGHDSCPFIKN